MAESFRLSGGLISRRTPLNFIFNGRGYGGFKGDTLASALLASGRHLVGRSFKYHRPRGILSAGIEEPNALVTIGENAEQDPNIRATVAELYHGMIARSQNHFGPLGFDMMAVNDALSSFLTAGFYYKTFMWPASLWEKVYEPLIRRAAGLGALSGLEDSDKYDKGHLHCDVLVIGGGAAGLTAALTAGYAGLRVILADEDFLMGGRLNTENDVIDGMASSAWATVATAELSSMPNVRIMPRTTVFGVFDHGIYGAVERLTEHMADRVKAPRQIMYRIYSKQAILAAGSIERPIAFANNDRPGIMLAGAVRSYANRYAVAAGKNVTVFTNNNDGWRTAEDLIGRGVNVAAIIDTRKTAHVNAPADVRIITGAGITGTKGRRRVESLTTTTGETIATDAIAVSGGWSPTVHLTCHHNSRPKWNAKIAGFVPAGEMPPGMRVAGAANGHMMLSEALKTGQEAAIEAAKDLGKSIRTRRTPKCEDRNFAIEAKWHIPSGRKRAWVDFQNDVTTKDITLAQKEGFEAVEHLKRYTTLGMGTDQGKTANIPALAVMAEITGKPIAEIGTTIFRPPYSPVPISVFAGRSRGVDFRETRLPPSHTWAEERGAVFVEAGTWMRAQWFPQEGETSWLESVNREVIATRSDVGICDVSTLGKIDIKGRDAGEFVNRVYANGFAKLPVGKARYGLMLREDGFVMDDGTTARLADNHYVMTTSTDNAGPVYRHLELYRQGVWPGLDVSIISTTDQYAQFAVAGPKSRRLLERLVDEFDLANGAFPFMSAAELTICGGIPARLFRISFSGEMAYELAVPARYGDALARVLMEAGEDLGVTPYGIEALSVMRIEKGHPAGRELNGQVSAHHLGLEGMLSGAKDFIGSVMAQREALTRPDGLRLVGLKPVDPAATLTAGAHFLNPGAASTASHDQGYMTSVAHSPNLGTSIGLGFIKDGRNRMGDVVRAADFVRGTDIEVTIMSPHFFDPEGARLHG
jgi:sarcosine oxidase subunit alpha